MNNLGEKVILFILILGKQWVLFGLSRGNKGYLYCKQGLSGKKVIQKTTECQLMEESQKLRKCSDGGSLHFHWEALK